ncbi:uncharacterized protein [Battus philenor]|uniref:uncharacterized protein n=1 Tax=Battus philenor TaxID=42288 RepID=UPI0035CFCA4B
MLYVFLALYILKSVHGCGVGVTPPLLRPPPGSRDWKHWELPPYNEDWIGFINLLGTRQVPEKTTTQHPMFSDDIIDIEHQPGFPKNWQDLGIGFTGMNPPKNAEIKGFVGQPMVCFELPKKGNGKSWYLRWYFDPHAGVCKRFIYSGSGGNGNKFITQYNCNVTCVNPPQLRCLSENLLDFNMYLNTPRRVIAIHL